MTNLVQLALAHEATAKAHAHLLTGRRALDVARVNLESIATEITARTDLPRRTERSPMTTPATTPAPVENAGDLAFHIGQAGFFRSLMNAETTDDVALGLRSLTHQLAALTAIAETAVVPREPIRELKPEIEEGWYDVELMGHRQRTGYLRTVSFASRQLIEITEPGYPTKPPAHSGDDDPEVAPSRVEYYAASAIFSLSATTERSAIAELTERNYRPF